MASPRKYTDQEVDAALLALFLEGQNANRAAELTEVSADTIRKWAKDTHADRYQAIVTKYAPQLDERLLRNYESMILEAQEVTRQGLEQAQLLLKTGRAKNPDQMAQRAAVIAGIASDKWLILQGRPNQITQSSDASEHLRALKAKFPWLITDEPVDATVVEPKELEA